MSAFVVSNLTLNRIVAGLVKHENNIPKLIIKEGIRPPSMEEMGDLLWLMNLDAVAQRYGETIYEVGYQSGDPYQLEKTNAPSDLQFLKYLQCLRYQCDEGNVPKQPLYHWLDALCDDLENRWGTPPDVLEWDAYPD